MPPGLEIQPDGSLAKTGGGAVVEEAVTVTAKRGFFRRVFGKVGRLLGFGAGPVTGAAHIIIGEMIDSQQVGGGDADIGVNEYGFSLDRRDTFLNGEFAPHRLTEDAIYYRVFSDPERMKGPFLTETHFTG